MFDRPKIPVFNPLLVCGMTFFSHYSCKFWTHDFLSLQRENARCKLLPLLLDKSSTSYYWEVLHRWCHCCSNLIYSAINSYWSTTTVGEYLKLYRLDSYVTNILRLSPPQRSFFPNDKLYITTVNWAKINYYL